MGKAFVAKLARQGARDPEALAAWIGRKKHGKKVFGKLSTAGRKNKFKASARETKGESEAVVPDQRREKGEQLLAAGTQLVEDLISGPQRGPGMAPYRLRAMSDKEFARHVDAIRGIGEAARNGVHLDPRLKNTYGEVARAIWAEKSRRARLR